jgi:hypothetical protein
MKCVQVRFDIVGDTVEYRCLYIKDELRGNSQFGCVSSCSCPEFTRGGETLYLRGEDYSRDDDVCFISKKIFYKNIRKILYDLLWFDKKNHSSTDVIEHLSIISVDGKEIVFDTAIQKKIIKYLEMKI